jgi:hypothetical protein
MATTKLSKEQVTEIFSAAATEVMQENRIPNSAKEIAAIELTCRRMVKKGVKDASYACNLLGMTSDKMYGRTGKTCKEIFTACWQKTINDVRNRVFHRVIEETFNVSLDGIRGQAAKNARFLLCAERNLEQVPELEIKVDGEMTTYAPTPIEWIAENIGKSYATQENWSKFQKSFTDNLKQYLNLRTGRVAVGDIFDDEEF